MSMVAEVLSMRGCLLECEECGDEGVSRSYTQYFDHGHLLYQSSISYSALRQFT